MKRLNTTTLSIALAGALLASLGAAQAQDIQPLAGSATTAAMGTAFTYQGQLRKSGALVGAPTPILCDFEFGLYDAPTGGTQLGLTQTLAAMVTNGLFTVPNLDFGSGRFNGEARWLAIAVMCPPDTSYTALSPRQALTPAPYALALPGLWTRQNVTSPNLVGGYHGNQVTNGVVAATIGGGGDSVFLNRVTDNYSTVGGGAANQAGNNAGTVVDAPFATVGGGKNNIASGDSTTVGGGQNNVASGSYATVSGGYSNTVTADSSTVGGGAFHTVTGTRATVGGGWQNTASGAVATVGGGQFNNASGAAATVGGGWQNTASGSDATVGGGFGNTASGQSSTVGGGVSNNVAAVDATIGGGTGNVISATAAAATIPGGYRAQATHYGELAYASGMFANPGDAQFSLYVLRNSTTSASATPLYLDGTGAQISIAPGRTVAFEILVAARDNSGNSAGYRFQGVVENLGAGAVLLSPSGGILHEDVPSWDSALAVSGSNLVIQALGGTSASPVRWVAVVRTAEVGW